jgi:hypothetical protein
MAVPGLHAKTQRALTGELSVTHDAGSIRASRTLEIGAEVPQVIE